MKLKDLTENQVVQTTAENDKQFRELLHKEGFEWCDGMTYVECSMFGEYETTCYNIKRGVFCSRYHYENEGKEILQASDFLTQKIKKSELLERIEVLEKKVADLEEKAKVTVVHPPIWSTEPGTVIGKGTIEGESEQPQFEVGKVYKNNCIFYCTKSGDCETLEAFGFNYKGYWEESINLVGSDFSDFTEATPEEWFKRLEEEAKKRYLKGAKMKCLRGWTEKPTSSWKDNEPLFFYEHDFSMLWARGINYLDICVMHNGKWAEIIEEPKTERYKMTKDQNAQIDCRMTECEFNNSGGNCSNISPAITLNDNKSFVCWSSSESEEPKTMTVEQRDELAKPFNPDEYQAGTLGAFWDGDWDEAIDETSILTAKLDKIVLGSYKPINRATCFQNFKPLKFD